MNPGFCTKYESLTVNAPILDPIRPRIDLAGPWSFGFLEGNGNADADWMQPEHRLPRQVVVPGPYQCQPDAFDGEIETGPGILPVDRRGTAWYARKINVPGDWAGRRILLKFGGVCPEAQIYVNGQLVGSHDLPQIAFGFDITELAPCGAEIDVRVRILENDRRKLGGLNQGWSGLWRTAELEAVGETFITDVFYRPEPATGCVRVLVTASQPGEYDTEIQIRDLQGNTVGRAAGRPNGNGIAVPLSSWSRWRPETPTLYLARVRLKQGDQLLDGGSVRFGLKDFATRGNRILLGGDPVFFMGFCIEGYDWGTVSPATDRAEIRSGLEELRGKGFNHARFHTHFPADEFLDVADEMGIMVSAEVPYVSNLRVIPDAEAAFAIWHRILLQTRHHASLAVYSMGNEGSQIFRDRHLDYVKKAYPLAKRLAPNALCIKTTGCAGDRPGPSDYETPSIGKGLSFMDAARGYADADWTEIEGVLARSPTILHEWAKVSALARIQEEPRLRSMRKSPGAFIEAHRTAQAKGLLGAWAQWVEPSEKVFWTCLKLNLELPRMLQDWGGWQVYLRHPSLHGSQNDSFIFPDMIRSVKAEQMLAVTGQMVILHDRGYRGRTLRPGADESVTFYLSNATPDPIEKARVSWQLVTTNGDVLAEAEWAAPRIAASGRTRLGQAVFVVPPTDRGLACRLVVQVVKDSQRLASNSWNYWIFPEPDIDTHRKKVVGLGGSPNLMAVTRAAGGIALPTTTRLAEQHAEVIVTSGFSADILRFITAGGRAVLFGGPFHELRARDIKLDVDRANFFVPYRAGWDDGNLGTVVTPHPALGDFPHEGFGDLQFFSLIDGAYPQELERWPVPIEPIIRAIPPLARPANRGYLFEFRCGKGKAIVSTFRAEDTPASVYLLSQLVEYACSDQFQPEPTVPERFLSGLLNPFYAGVPDVPQDIINVSEQLVPGAEDAPSVSLSGIANAPTALAKLEPGSCPLGGVPFEVDARCFSPRSPLNFLAPWSAEVTVGRNVKAIHLLWALTDLSPRPLVADYAGFKVRLASGLAPTMPLRHNPGQRDRGFTQEELAGLTATGTGHSVHVSTWRNPRPADPVDSIVFAGEGKQGRVFLVALSVTPA